MSPESPALQRLAQLAQNDRAGLYGRILDQLFDALVVVDEAGAVVLFNFAAELLFGWSREDVIGKPVELLLPVELSERHASHRQGFFAEPRTRSMGVHDMRLVGRRRDGQEIPVTVGLAPVVDRAGLFALATIRRA